uniref:hAT-like transposase RNase-H fold domain-containing protein n=1 Tax=Lactuca sativa TaxID=4236 RepID=A0A9R1UHM3_LACSA|nr:hypothetical protein LSAT_V11C900468750 [Lactuca sativa]
MGSNDTTISFLKKKIQIWGHAVLDAQYLHMRCCAHVLNLILCDGLKDGDLAIQVIRNVVMYVRSSLSRLGKFKECVKIEKLNVPGTICLDVSTKWKSTYLMLESALKYRKAFNRLEEDGYYARFFNVGPSSLLNEVDAKKSMMSLKSGHLVILIGMLNKHYVTNWFSRSLYVTSSAYFHDMCSLHSHINEYIKSDDWRVSSMAMNMKEKLGNAEKMNPLLYVDVLEPLYKLEYVNWSLEEMYPIYDIVDLKKKLKATLTRLYDFYLEKHPMYAKNSSSNNNHNKRKSQVMSYLTYWIGGRQMKQNIRFSEKLQGMSWLFQFLHLLRNPHLARRVEIWIHLGVFFLLKQCERFYAHKIGFGILQANLIFAPTISIERPF